jgi:hypothetical protein
VPNQAEWNAKAPEGPAGPQPSNMSVIRSTPVKWRAQIKAYAEMGIYGWRRFGSTLLGA